MRAAVVLVVAAIVSGCAGRHSPSPVANGPSGPALTVATSPGGNEYAALLTGVLRGRVNLDGTACFWVHRSGQHHGIPTNRPQDIAIRWPHGTVAYSSPLRVTDRSGRVIARIGHRVTVGGGALPDGELPLLGCPRFAHAFG